MRARQLSIAESLMDARALLDGRYRLDALIRRSATATIHVATHRNGSSAWLKMPVSAAHAQLIALEARIANTLGSPLTVRDDGTTPDGIAYLVLDPPEAESVAALRTRGRSGLGLPLAVVTTAGDALARVVGSLHAMGYVTAGLADDDVLVFANGGVALLDLHALLPASAAGVAADVSHVARVLTALVSEVAEAASPLPARAALAGVLAASYRDVGALQLAWRAAAPELLAISHRPRANSLVESEPLLPAHDTPLSLSVGADEQRASEAYETDGSVIGYLRSGAVPSVPPPAPGPRERPMMYDPLSKLADTPRLVQAMSRAPQPEKRSPRNRALIGVLIASSVVAVAAMAGAAALLLSGSGPSARTAATAAPEARTAAPAAPEPKASPPAALVAPSAPASAAAPLPSAAASAEPAEELELTSRLRTETAPPDRDVFIDGKVIGKTPLDTSVPCGRHTLQMVAGAPMVSVELPCGGVRTVRYDAKGHWTLIK